MRRHASDWYTTRFSVGDDWMTDTEPTTSDATIRFPSLDSLRAAHTELLKDFRADGGTTEMIAKVEDFIRRGRATGALLNTDADRWAAQSQLEEVAKSARIGAAHLRILRWRGRCSGRQ